MIQGFNNIFSKEQIEQVQKLYTSLSAEQKYWLSGYLAGLNQSGKILEGVATENNEQTSVLEEGGNSVKLTIVYGTHTGNSKLLAEQALGIAKDIGIDAHAFNMQDYKLRKIKEEENLLIIVSTHGEGEPPVSAEDFYAYIFGKKVPKKINLNYAVIGLGDSSYAKFCQTGKDIFNQLEKLGANSVHDFVELDVDYKDHIASVLPNVLSKFSNNSANIIKSVKTESVTTAMVVDEWVEAEVLEKVLLNGKGSAKETYHIELDIEGTGLKYQPGDALEVVAKNNQVLVNDILQKLNISGDSKVKVGNEETNIEEALVDRFELTVVTIPVLKKYAEKAQLSELNELIKDEQKLNEYLYGIDFLDLINDYPSELKVDDVPVILRKLPARLYSISSSYEYNPDEVHITVGAVRYHLNDRDRNGVCSGYLADNIFEGSTVKVRVKPNLGFKLPENKEIPVVMVGPGTGIAPFRSFLQEREANEAVGKNWLFFGDQHFETDFLYQTELLKYRKDGLVDRLDVAFSRDQEEKIYVQHRMNENGEELYKWLNEGAHFYLCGDMKRMAKDVKEALLQILKKYGNLTEEQAQDYFKNLKTTGRFQEDVY